MNDPTSAEEWAPVLGCEDLYLVSDQGRVWSLRVGRMMATHLWRGHRRVNLWHEGRCLKRGVGPLVLEAFVGPRPAGTECCHGFGGPADDRLCNLRWDTREENFLDVYRHAGRCEDGRPRCPRGHELVDANVYPARRNKGRRACWACAKAHNDASTRRRRGEYVEDTYATADEHYARLIGTV